MLAAWAYGEPLSLDMLPFEVRAMGYLMNAKRKREGGQGVVRVCT